MQHDAAQFDHFLPRALEVLIVHLADASDQQPICSKTVHASLQPDVVATSSAALCLHRMLSQQCVCMCMLACMQKQTWCAIVCS